MYPPAYFRRMKHYTAVLAFLLCAFLLGSCQSEALRTYRLSGYAQGTTYHITYRSPRSLPAQAAVDSIFTAIDRSVSTYNENSYIVALNQGDSVQLDPVLWDILAASQRVYRLSEGAFDPTVGPLVQFWGFGADKNRTIDSSLADSLLMYVGFDRLAAPAEYWRLPDGFQLDFNAIAQGYTVDQIAEYFNSSGVENYMVEVGGEVRCRGRNEEAQLWRIGVDKPQEEIDTEDRFQFILALDSTSLATSGNYRKFWTDPETGARYAHTIDPRSGFPARNRLLSVSVLAREATFADAFATAFMVMGYSEARSFLAKHPDLGLEAYFILASSTPGDTAWEEFTTPGFEQHLP